MFARLTKFQIKTDKIEIGTDLYNKSVVPALKSQKGFKKTFLLVNNKTGDGMAIGLWETEADVLASEHNLFYQEQLIKFLGMLSDPTYIREGYEVKLEA
jgi:heme-degrading monooxygenase HmoA